MRRTRAERAEDIVRSVVLGIGIVAGLGLLAAGSVVEIAAVTTASAAHRPSVETCASREVTVR